MRTWMGLLVACASAVARAEPTVPTEQLASQARLAAEGGHCDAAMATLARLGELDAARAREVRAEPAIASCAPAQLAPPAPCRPVYGEIWAGGGRSSRFGQAIKNARIAVGYESAPQRCAATWNVKVGGVFEISNQADDYTLFGGELELDRWIPGLGYAGGRAAAVIDSGGHQPNRIVSLGVRVHTTMSVSVGLDASWAKVGPTETSRLGGDSAFGLAASLGVRGKLAAVVAGFATVAAVVLVFGYHDNS